MMSLSYFFILLISIMLLFFIVVYPLFVRKSDKYFSQKTMDFDESLSIMELITELEADYLLKKINKEDFEAVSTDLKRKYLKITENKA
jgi:hypothetical protein